MRTCQTLRQKLMLVVLTLLLAAGIFLAACVVKGETTPTLISKATPTAISTTTPILSPTPKLTSVPTSTPTLTNPPKTSKPESQSGRVWLDSYTYLVGGNGQPIVLVNNPNASNPTLLQLLDFVRNDQTDKIPYSSAFVCADFAETLYNSAESQNIKAAYIVFSGVDHALNAFQTTDAGLIFIDCTGESSQAIPQINTAFSNTFGEASSCDKVAYIESGKPLGVISLDAAASHYGFSYSGYEQWKKDKELFDTKLDSYNRQVNGRLFVSQPEYDQLQEEFHIIDLLKNQLGAFWEEAGVVQSYQIFWEGE